MKYLIKRFFHHCVEATQYNRYGARRFVLHCRTNDLHLKGETIATGKYYQETPDAVSASIT